MKIRTINQLQDNLDADYAWRLKEIADLKLFVKNAPPSCKRAGVRMMIPMIYAHWEGFVKFAAESYLNFVQCQRLTYKDLTSCFSVLGLKRKLSELKDSKKTKANIEAFDFILEQANKRANVGLSAAINTKANLNSEVFENIYISIGLDPRPFELRYHQIDYSLLRIRNGIAHGQYLDITESSCVSLADDILELLKRIKGDIMLSANTQRFRR